MSSSDESIFAYSLEHAVMGSADVDNDTANKVLAVLRAPDSLRKRIAVRILHKRAAAYLREQPEYASQYTSAEAIDWTKVDWQKIIVGLLKILLMILPFIL